MNPVPPISPDKLQGLCDALSGLLTNRTIQQRLSALEIEDVPLASNKATRLFSALSKRQTQDRCANQIIAFLQHTLSPAHFINDAKGHDDALASVNRALSFAGYRIDAAAKSHSIVAASTLAEAERQTKSLRQVLRQRGIHPDVLRYCDEELFTQNRFHAVLEATKSAAQKVRDKADIQGDGAAVFQKAFGGAFPLLALNSLQTESERSEQSGFVSLCTGAYGMFRNTTAHTPKLHARPIDDNELIEVLTLLSLIHRQLDRCIRIPQR